MYLKKAVVLNAGPINNLELNARFDTHGRPIPIMLVGTNGSGKTSFLSHLGDSLIELAASAYQGVTEAEGIGRKYFRTLGVSNYNPGGSFEAALLEFNHRSIDLSYTSIAGNIDAGLFATKADLFSQPNLFPNMESGKHINANGVNLSDVFESEAHLFLPSMRYENPYWLNVEAIRLEPPASFDPRFKSRLENPIVIQTSMRQLKPWLFDVMLDSGNTGFEHSLKEVNEILKYVMNDPSVFIARTNRMLAERRMCIAGANGKFIPTLDHISSGQSALLSIFWNIIRFGDRGVPPKSIADIEGIAIIDEIDTHLHADLQHVNLPKLISMFPKVQFIVSSHAPLLALGMKNQFGDDGFSMVELPSGKTIDVERFSEFVTSFEYFKSTQKFENEIEDRIKHGTRPVVICEGDTDPRYLKAAARVLGYDDIESGVDFEWIGTKDSSGSTKGGGSGNIDSAVRFLRSNPQFITRRTLMLYDCDKPHKPEDFGDLHVRSIDKRVENTHTDSGIENLLPDTCFEDRFYFTKELKSGTKKTTVRDLRKEDLCDHLCSAKGHSADFEGFRSTLDMVRTTLLG